MGDGLHVRLPVGGETSGPQPLLNRALAVARHGQMMRQQFRLSLNQIGEIPFNHCRDASMQFLPASTQ